VLISPISIGRPNWSEKILPTSLTMDQVKNSPDIDTDKPVSRQHEMGYLGYYGYGNYWGGGGLWGAGIYPDVLQAGLLASKREIRSVANLTRQDGTEFLNLAPTIGIVTKTNPYPLQEANRALADLRAGKFEGAAVVIP
jgi:hypothetical protein